MKACMALAGALAASPIAAQENPNFKQLKEDGFLIAGASLDRDDLLIVLERGEQSYLCTLGLKRTEGGFSTGPWNNYRSCDRMSGGADFTYNLETRELEPSK